MSTVFSHLRRRLRASWRYLYALALIATAGAVDAVGFLHLGTFYVSFMSGNTTRTAVALALGQRSDLIQGGSIILGFIAGVVLGELLSHLFRGKAAPWLLVEAMLLFVAAFCGKSAATSVVLAFAMGMHSAQALTVARVSLALTYVTGTLVQLGRALGGVILRRSDRKPLWPMFGEWCALFSGAVFGAAIHSMGEGASLFGLAAVLIILAGADWLIHSCGNDAIATASNHSDPVHDDRHIAGGA